MTIKGQARNNLAPNAQKKAKLDDARISNLDLRLKALESLNPNAQLNRLAMGAGDAAVRVVPFSGTASGATGKYTLPLLDRAYTQANVMLDITILDTFDGSAYAAFQDTLTTYIYTTDDGFTEIDVLGGTDTIFYHAANITSSKPHLFTILPVNLGNVLEGYSLCVKSGTTSSGAPIAAWSGSEVYYKGCIVYTKEIV